MSISAFILATVCLIGNPKECHKKIVMTSKHPLTQAQCQELLNFAALKYFSTGKVFIKKATCHSKKTGKIRAKSTDLGI